MIYEKLVSFVYDVQRIGGVVGILKNGDGKTVLHRSDIDTLPIKEIYNLPYSSKFKCRYCDFISQYCNKTSNNFSKGN